MLGVIFFMFLQGPVGLSAIKVYISPELNVTDSLEVANLTFYSADSSSNYGIIIEGTSSLGHLIYTSSEVVEVE